MEAIFSRVGEFKEDDLKIALQSFDLVTGEELEMFLAIATLGGGARSAFTYSVHRRRPGYRIACTRLRAW